MTPVCARPLAVTAAASSCPERIFSTMSFSSPACPFHAKSSVTSPFVSRGDVGGPLLQLLAPRRVGGCERPYLERHRGFGEGRAKTTGREATRHARMTAIRKGMQSLCSTMKRASLLSLLGISACASAPPPPAASPQAALPAPAPASASSSAHVVPRYAAVLTSSCSESRDHAFPPKYAAYVGHPWKGVPRCATNSLRRRTASRSRDASSPVEQPARRALRSRPGRFAEPWVATRPPLASRARPRSVSECSIRHRSQVSGAASKPSRLSRMSRAPSPRFRRCALVTRRRPSCSPAHLGRR